MPLVGSGNSFGGITGSNAAARLLVVISGTSAPLTAAIAQAEGTLAGFQKNAGAIGKALTRTLTLPALAIGGAAVAAAAQFENLIARIAGLTPLASRFGLSMDQVRSSLLAIADDPQVIAGPNALADSLYYAGSAGLDVKDSFDVVKLSAQGMSTGMGEASDISKLLIFALNNYPGAALDASTAMDTLTAAIQEGTAAPDEMAIALGRLLPVAAKAGISFQQVVASVAALTNLGVPTRVATTSLRALFSQLLAPTIQATELLDQLGVTAQDLRDRLKLGPVAAFQLLEEATRGNVDQLHDLVPQIRAITALYGLTGDKAKRYQEILDAVNNSQGKFQKALDEISKTPGFQFSKSLQELQKAGIVLGSKLFPIFRGIASVVSAIAQAFTDLPGPVQAGVAALLVFAAAIGPLIQLGAAMTETKTITLGLMQAVVPTGKAIATSFTVAGIAAAGAAAAFVNMNNAGASLINVAIGLVSSFVAFNVGLKAIQASLSAIASEKLATGVLSGFLGLSAGQLTAISAGLAGIAVAIAGIIAADNRMTRESGQLHDALFQGATGAQTFGQALDGIDGNRIAGELKGVAQAMGLINAQITTSNLDKFREGIGVDLSKQVAQLAQMSHFFAETVPNASKLPQLIEQGAANGDDLNTILAKAGLTTDSLIDKLGDVGTQDTSDPGINETVGDITKLIFAYNEAKSVRESFNETTAASIDAHTEEQAALERLASHGGGSLDFVSGKLQELGLTARQVTPEMEDNFFNAAYGMDSAGNIINGAAAEAKDAIASMAQDMSDSLQQTFGLFDEFPDKVKKSTAQLAAHANKAAQLAVQQTQDILTLARRGVPSGLIDELVNAGLTRKFATANDKELSKLVSAYQVRLAAMDANILKEAQHQEKKGSDMVQGFASAILGSKAIVGNAANGIMQTIINAFDAGKISDKGLQLATSFAHSLGRARGLSKQQGTAAMQAFANAIASGRFVDKAGNVMVNELANAVAKGANIAKSKARELVQGAVQGIEDQSPKAENAAKAVAARAAHSIGSHNEEARSQGLALSAYFAQGITAGGDQAVSAAEAVAARAKAAMDAALRSSPEYFTYYMGKKLVDDMDRGVRDAGRLRGHRPTVMMGGGRSGGDLRGLRVQIVDSNLGVRMTGIVVDQMDQDRVYHERLGRRHRQRVMG